MLKSCKHETRSTSGETSQEVWIDNKCGFSLQSFINRLLLLRDSVWLMDDNFINESSVVHYCTEVIVYINESYKAHVVFPIFRNFSPYST